LARDRPRDLLHVRAPPQRHGAVPVGGDLEARSLPGRRPHEQTAGAAAAFIAGDADDIAIIWRNAREAGLAIEIAGGETLALLPYSQAAEGLPLGLLAVTETDIGASDAASALSQRLVARGIEPEPFVLIGYAAIEVALAALAETPAQTTARLRNGVFQTVTGPVSFAMDGQNVHDGYTLQTWNGKGFEPATEAMR
jgi:ABC-type branched-subunit amino acid transport system substrate-binding protein